VLAGDDEDARVPAIDLLSEIGPEAKEAVPALLKTLKGNDLLARLLAATALGKIDPKAAKEAGLR
jgi:HEAT repeat protein